MIIPEDGCLPQITRCGLSAFNNVMIIKVPDNLRKPGETTHQLATLDRTKKGEQWPADKYVYSILNQSSGETSTSESNQKRKHLSPFKKSPFKKTSKFQNKKLKTKVSRHSFDNQKKPHAPISPFPPTNGPNLLPSFIPNATFPNPHETNRETVRKEFPNRYQQYNESNNNSLVEGQSSNHHENQFGAQCQPVIPDYMRGPNGRNRAFNEDIVPAIPFNGPPAFDFRPIPPPRFRAHDNNFNDVSVPNSISNGFPRISPLLSEPFLPIAPRNNFNPISHGYPRKPLIPGPFIANPPENSYKEGDRANSNFVERDFSDQVIDNNTFMTIPRHRQPENNMERDFESNRRGILPQPNAFDYNSPDEKFPNTFHGRDPHYDGERPFLECGPNPGFNRESGNRNEIDSRYNETRKFWNDRPNPGFNREHGVRENRNFFRRNRNFRNDNQNRTWNKRNGFNVKSSHNFSRGRGNYRFNQKKT